MKQKKKVKVGVQTVRQRGGDCLESVRQRVRVVREEEAAAGVQLHEVPDTAAEDRARAEARRSAAEERGREAARRLEQDHWLEERLARAEAERKEAVKLTEMLRTARILSQAKSDTDPPAAAAPSQQHPNPNPDRTRPRKSQEKGKEKEKGSRKVARVTENVDAPSKGQAAEKASEKSKPRPRPILISSQRQTDARPQPSLPPAPAVPLVKQNEVRSLVSAVKPLDSTEEPSSMCGLSTILEVSEHSQLTASVLPRRRDEVDTAEAAADTARSMSPFPDSEAVTVTRRPEAEVAMTDLAAVRKLIDRVKKQGEQIQLSDEHFLNVTGQAMGRPSKGGNESISPEKYSVNQQFIKKVLEFSASPSLSLSSDESSSFRPVQLPASRAETADRKKVQPLKSKTVPVKFFEQSQSVLSPIPKTLENTKNTSVNDSTKYAKHIPSQSLSHLATFSRGGQQPPGPGPRPQLSQAQLRYYIVKLLQMRAEEVAELSVSTTGLQSSSSEAGARGKMSSGSGVDTSSSSDTFRDITFSDS